MDTADIIWGGLILAGAGFEAYALRNGRDGDTASEKTRKIFHVKTSKVGRAIFLIVWLGLSGWFTGHVLDWWW